MHKRTGSKSIKFIFPNDVNGESGVFNSNFERLNGELNLYRKIQKLVFKWKQKTTLPYDENVYVTSTFVC